MSGPKFVAAQVVGSSERAGRKVYRLNVKTAPPVAAAATAMMLISGASLAPNNSADPTAHPATSPQAAAAPT